MADFKGEFFTNFVLVFPYIINTSSTITNWKTSENFLNEIRPIVYFCIKQNRSQERHATIYLASKEINTRFMTSENKKTSDTHRLGLNLSIKYIYKEVIILWPLLTLVSTTYGRT